LKASQEKPITEMTDPIFQQYGPPFLVDDNDNIVLNYRAVALKCANLHSVRYDTGSKGYERFDRNRGLWVVVDEVAVARALDILLIELGETYGFQEFVRCLSSSKLSSMEETFSDHLVKGRTFIQFDNVRGKLDSQFLESFFTADKGYPARTFQNAQIMVDPANFIIFISSNGFEATRDLTNRASIIRIKKREGHQFRLKDGKDDLQMTFELQHVWYGAVLTVIKEWHRLGKKRTNDTRHSFREWCQILDWIVQNLFKAAPLMDDHEEAKERAASPNLTFLRTLAIAVQEDHQLNHPLTATQLVNLCVEKEIDIPGLSEDKQADVEAGRKQLGMIMGKLFGEKTELPVEDFRVAKTEETATTDQGNPQIMKRYTFSTSLPANTPAPANRAGNLGPAPP
jgi:hypothetical protein